MNWSLIFCERPVRGRSTRSRGVLHRRHRAQRARRLHRTAQLRPGRVRRPRCLRLRHPDRQLRLAVVLGAAFVFAASILLALLLGIPTLRLHADYLAIVTIAAAEIIRYVLASDPVHMAHRWNRWPAGMDLIVPGPQPVGQRRPILSSAPRALDGYRVFMMVVGWSLVAAPRARGVAADAQPLGPRPQEHPRGRGRRPGARQERRRLQDAEPHDRRSDRLDRRPDGSPPKRKRPTPASSPPT